MTRNPDLDPEILAELDAAMNDPDFGHLLGGPGGGGGADAAGTPGGAADGSSGVSRASAGALPFSLVPGAKYAGLIMAVAGDDVFVDLGPKLQGVCPSLQFEKPPVQGESHEFTFLRYSEEDGLYLLNRAGAVQKAEWEHLNVGQVVSAKCTGTNKGGLTMEVANHKAFMPAGQASIWHIENLETLVGESMACEVIEFDRKGKRIVLSRRAVMERERAVKREETLAALEVGQTVNGTVRKIMPFGAFVDIGGVDGLVHVSDMSYQRVADPATVVTVGQAVTVKVLKVDREENRIGLGLKQCQDDPFMGVTQALTVGAEVTGRVTKIADFGAFVEIQPGVEGLVHISELSHDRVNQVSQIVKQDEIVTVKVLSIDPATRRIGLSLKATKAKQEAEHERQDDRAMSKLRLKFGGTSGLKGGLDRLH